MDTPSKALSQKRIESTLNELQKGKFIAHKKNSTLKPVYLFIFYLSIYVFIYLFI